jgi:hypothetical protein
LYPLHDETIRRGQLQFIVGRFKLQRFYPVLELLRRQLLLEVAKTRTPEIIHRKPSRTEVGEWSESKRRRILSGLTAVIHNAKLRA